jgi:uncharacterized protein (DUF111 family)
MKQAIFLAVLGVLGTVQAAHATVAVPEPATLTLVGVGAGAVAVAKLWRSRRK